LAIVRPVAVTNTSPIIALVGVGRLDLFGVLFERVIVPFEVWSELTDKSNAAEPPRVVELPNAYFLPAPLMVPGQDVLDFPAGLHAGERAAISLAKAHGAWALLDDGEARRTATRLGLFVKGTLGILIQGKRAGAVAAVRPLVEAMIANGCRFAPGLVEEVLRAVGEGG